MGGRAGDHGVPVSLAARAGLLGGVLLALLAGALALPGGERAPRQPLRGASAQGSASRSADVKPASSSDARPTSPARDSVTPGSTARDAPGSAPADEATGEPRLPPIPRAAEEAYPEPDPREVAALERASAAGDPYLVLDVARDTRDPLLRLEALARFVEGGGDLSGLLPWGFELDHDPLHGFVGATLADGGTVELVHPLQRWLDDPRPGVRLAAAEALLGIGARHPGPWVRAALVALRALVADAQLGPRAVDCLADAEQEAGRATLEQVARDPLLPAAVREDAAAALDRAAR